MTAKRMLCLVCHRGQKYFEGCSHMDCPCRKPLTACTNEGTLVKANGYAPANTSFVRAETIGEDED